MSGKSMKLTEIIELMKLQGWNQRELARRLDLNEATVSRWFKGEHHPTGPARILMRQWLSEARGKKKEPVPA